jgi:hypothetical protein
MNRKTRAAFHTKLEAVWRMSDERRGGRAKSWAVNFMSDLKLFRLSSGGVSEMKGSTLALERSLQTLFEQNLSGGAETSPRTTAAARPRRQADAALAKPFPGLALHGSRDNSRLRAYNTNDTA